MAAPTKVTFPSRLLRITAEFYSPVQGSPDRNGAAIVLSHPMTGVKEQTVADYARALSAAGFYALTFDAGYQGESTGEPRGLEDPYQRVEDIKSAVSYLTTLRGSVDTERIGLLGICASGGYGSYAAQSDIRIKALATVSAACFGAMTRNGGVYEHQKENPEVIAAALNGAASLRTAQANGLQVETPILFDADPTHVTPDTDSFFRDGAAYYGTSRGRHERSNRRVPLQSYDLAVNYDSFRFQHLISPRPLLMIAGTDAQTYHLSKKAIGVAEQPKELFTVKGKNHVDLYDDLSETGPKLVEFYGSVLV